MGHSCVRFSRHLFCKETVLLKKSFLTLLCFCIYANAQMYSNQRQFAVDSYSTFYRVANWAYKNKASQCRIKIQNQNVGAAIPYLATFAKRRGENLPERLKKHSSPNQMYWEMCISDMATGREMHATVQKIASIFCNPSMLSHWEPYFRYSQLLDKWFYNGTSFNVINMWPCHSFSINLEDRFDNPIWGPSLYSGPHVWGMELVINRNVLVSIRYSGGICIGEMLSGTPKLFVGPCFEGGQDTVKFKDLQKGYEIFKEDVNKMYFNVNHALPFEYSIRFLNSLIHLTRLRQ